MYRNARLYTCVCGSAVAVFVFTEFSRDIIFHRALNMYMYQPVPLRKNKSYEPISTATECNADKREGEKKITAGLTNFHRRVKKQRKKIFPQIRFFESMEKRLQKISLLLPSSLCYT